ncbi:MAG: hypothetical protein R2720_06920 [Candidatus Nanopelagicales bacterium]
MRRPRRAHRQQRPRVVLGGYVNVALDAGSNKSRKKMIFGYIPNIAKYVTTDCGD